MIGKIKFSVIMPAYNAEKTIEKSIQSLIDQVYENWELVIVNDGSKDNTKDVVNRYAGEDARIIYIEQDNAGPGAARNNGMRNCSGDYIAFLDSDDYYDKCYLEQVYLKCELGKVDVVFTDRVYEDDNGKISGYTHIYNWREAGQAKILRNQMTGIIPWGFGKVFKFELYKKASGFTNLKVGEEALFSFDIVYNAKTLAFVEKPMIHVIRQADGQHTKGDYDPWYQVVDAIELHLKELGIYGAFEKDINSFALRGLCIAIYRISMKNTFFKAISKYKEYFEKYCKKYQIARWNNESIDKSSKIIYFCLKLRMYPVIYMASRYRGRKICKKN